MHFLIVDDEPLMRDTIAEILYSVGFTSVQTSNPKEVAKIVETSHFDYVITDIGMPGLNGLELMREIKKVSPTTKFICVSGFSDMFIDEIKDLAELTFQKPINPADFLREIQILSKAKN